MPTNTEDTGINGIKELFELFSSAAMNARPYVKKSPLPATVTVPLGPEEMEMLLIISARIGAPRTNVAHHILKVGLCEAFLGCGFTWDENGNIREEEMKWDTSPRKMGISFPGNEEAA